MELDCLQLYMLCLAEFRVGMAAPESKFYRVGQETRHLEHLVKVTASVLAQRSHRHSDVR